jgi:motility quorum-sensing regulator / GCU-specific mRNA interferase toxin
MEKSMPHCKLLVIKDLIEAGKIRTTKAALVSAEMMGFDFDDMLGVVKGLTPQDF